MSEKEIDRFYDELQKAHDELENATWFKTMGDFNSKVDSKIDGEEDVMHNFGLGSRNGRGKLLVRFARSNQMFIAKFMFKKRKARKWT